MPTKAQLDTQAEQLRKSIHDLETSDAPEPEKKEAFDKIYAEYETYTEQRKSLQRSEDMMKGLGLGQGPEIRSGEEGNESPLDMGHVPNLSQMKSVVARQIMNHPGFKSNLAKAKRSLSPSPEDFEVSLKDATATNNLVGEALYGSTGPTPAGQNPFLSGAVGPAVMPYWVPGISDLKYFQLRFSDLLTSFSTDAPIVSYLREATSVRNAAATAEGGTYPFSSGTFSRVYEQIGKITNAMVMTDETLDDAPMIASFLQNTLLDGVVRQEDFALLAGNGVPGVNGLLSRSTSFQKPQTITASTNVVVPASSTPGLGANPYTIASLTYGRKITGATGVYPTAMAIAEGVFQASVDIEYNTQFVPNAIVVNPLDWAVIRLGKDNNNQYYGSSFFGYDYGNGHGAPDTLWGKRIVSTPAMPQGSILVGYFGPEAIQVARRSGISFQMTNSNQDDFINGRVTMRAEERLGLLVQRPSVFELINVVSG